MRDRDLERRLRTLQPREPDPHFVESLRARIRMEVLSAAPPRPWWHGSVPVLANAALACCLVAMFWLPPGRASPLARVVPGPGYMSQLRRVDPEVQAVYGPERLHLVQRMEGRPAMRAPGQASRPLRDVTVHGAEPESALKEVTT